MTTPSTADLRGVPPERVRDALRDGDPLPGGRGFAGLLRDPPNREGPVLVRDVLGRQPLFVERGVADPMTEDGPTTPGAWSFDRTDLDDPEPLRAGALLSSAGTERVWSLPDGEAVDPEPGQAGVDEALDAALGDLDVGDLEAERDGNDLAVAFSGGIDSGVVAAAVPDAPCYVAGFEGCHDVAA
ncbi:asparagine synthase, partial [Halorubrum saccharovorum]